MRPVRPKRQGEADVIALLLALAVMVPFVANPEKAAGIRLVLAATGVVGAALAWKLVQGKRWPVKVFLVPGLTFVLLVAVSVAHALKLF